MTTPTTTLATDADPVARSTRAAQARLDAQLPGLAAAGDGTVCVGADVQGVAAVRDALARHGERYLAHLFSPQERRALRWPDASPDRVAPRVASRFAAKEALLKALRPPSRSWSWHDVQVLEAEPWEVALGGGALVLASQRGVSRWALSCVSDATHAVALVIGVGPGTHYAAGPPAALGGA